MRERGEPQSRRPAQAPPDRTCPLCGAAMIARARDPLVRCLGFMLLYVSAVLLLLWLPTLDPGRVLAVVVLASSGCVIMRRREELWCAECWYCE